MALFRIRLFMIATVVTAVCSVVLLIHYSYKKNVRDPATSTKLREETTATGTSNRPLKITNTSTSKEPSKTGKDDADNNYMDILIQDALNKAEESVGAQDVTQVKEVSPESGNKNSTQSSGDKSEHSDMMELCPEDKSSLGE